MSGDDKVMVLNAKRKPPHRDYPYFCMQLKLEAITLLLYNFILALVISNQEMQWEYEYQAMDASERYGLELIEPIILSQFGFFFRLITIIVNSLILVPIASPHRKYRAALLPPIIWNFYTVVITFINIVELIWAMALLVVPWHVHATILICGFFVLSLECKLMLQALRFYEFLNYVT